MGKREKLVSKVVSDAYNLITGGHENALSDYKTPMPSKEEMVDEIYSEVMHTSYVEWGPYLLAVKKDIRFVGQARIRQMIEEKFAEEGL